MSWTQGGQTQSTGVKLARVDPRLVVDEAKDGGGARKTSFGDQKRNGGHLRIAGGRPRRAVQA